MTSTIVWIVALACFIVIEACTSALVSIWFAFGALGALVAKGLGAGITAQVFVFLIVSVVCVFALRSLASSRLKPRRINANLDRIIGQEVVITETVDNAKHTGATTINDVDWKVRAEKNQVIPVGERVIVKAIDGVKLIVGREN